MNSSVITFPGSNCDRDMDVALKKFGFKNKMVWHDDVELPKSDLVVLPGGFSYGDYLRCGSMASKSKIMKSVLNFAQGGGKVMGICNGFQILVESGLLPGVLLRNKYLQFICKNVFVKAEIMRVAKGEASEHDKHNAFYDEYLAVMDMTAEFYLSTVERIFKGRDIARNEFVVDGRKVDIGKITTVAVKIVEGENRSEEQHV